MTTAPVLAQADPAGAVLSEAADTLDLLVYAEARQLELAVEWAHLHPGDEVDLSIPYGDRDLQVAGDGAPTVAEFAIADFALTLGLSTDAGRNLIGDAVELHHRLPRLWDRVVTGEVRVWKARRIAQATRCLPPEAAAYVDRQVARVAHRCSYAQVERTVERAKAEHDPAALEAERARHADDRYVRVRTEDLTTDGKVYIDALVDLPDALAFEAAIATRAHALVETHPDLFLASGARWLSACSGTAPARPRSSSTPTTAPTRSWSTSTTPGRSSPPRSSSSGAASQAPRCR